MQNENSAAIHPNLYIRRGRTLIHVTPVQASKVMVAKRERSTMRQRPIPLYSAEGLEIGRVSHNGRVWISTQQGEVEVPLPGVKTAAQCEAEGWR